MTTTTIYDSADRAYEVQVIVPRAGQSVAAVAADLGGRILGRNECQDGRDDVVAAIQDPATTYYVVRQ